MTTESLVKEIRTLCNEIEDCNDVPHARELVMQMGVYCTPMVVNTLSISPATHERLQRMKDKISELKREFRKECLK